MDRQKCSKTYFYLFTLIIAACVATRPSAAYKLNVPKVLLPFQSSKLISFVLEAKTETDNGEDLCFVWSSSKPDVVAISPIYDTGKTGKAGCGDTNNNINNNRNDRSDCTAKAIVTAVSKHSQRMTSIILAKETSNFQKNKINFFNNG
jgi:hypothetical protein